jgi:hypothetical protein
VRPSCPTRRSQRCPPAREHRENAESDPVEKTLTAYGRCHWISSVVQTDDGPRCADCNIDGVGAGPAGIDKSV